MYITVCKINGVLVFENIRGYQTRNESTIECIKEADKIYKWKDFSDKIIIGTNDKGDNKNLSYSQSNNYNLTIPDFNFHGWPECGVNNYEETINKIHLSGLKPYKINKVGWVGNGRSCVNGQRHKLLYLGRQNKSKLDIIDMGGWTKRNIDNIDHNKPLFLNPTNYYLSMNDLTEKYSILIDIEGVGYSARLKYLLWSHRPLIIIDREWEEYFFEYLEPWVHYIPVKHDMSDLLENVNWIMNNYHEACIIADNAYQFSLKYLTKEACYKQFDKIFKLHRNI